MSSGANGRIAFLATTARRRSTCLTRLTPIWTRDTAPHSAQWCVLVSRGVDRLGTESAPLCVVVCAVTSVLLLHTASPAQVKKQAEKTQFIATTFREELVNVADRFLLVSFENKVRRQRHAWLLALRALALAEQRWCLAQVSSVNTVDKRAAQHLIRSEQPAR
jgi:hypothetical protein